MEGHQTSIFMFPADLQGYNLIQTEKKLSSSLNVSFWPNLSFNHKDLALIIKFYRMNGVSSEIKTQGSWNAIISQGLERAEFY